MKSFLTDRLLSPSFAIALILSLFCHSLAEARIDSKQILNDSSSPILKNAGPAVDIGTHDDSQNNLSTETTTVNSETLNLQNTKQLVISPNTYFRENLYEGGIPQDESIVACDNGLGTLVSNSNVPGYYCQVVYALPLPAGTTIKSVEVFYDLNQVYENSAFVVYSIQKSDLVNGTYGTATSASQTEVYVKNKKKYIDDQEITLEKYKAYHIKMTIMNGFTLRGIVINYVD
jgi:hypothetical protein